MADRTLRLLIADDHEVVRRGLGAVLESQPGWRVVAEGANGREAVELARQHKPDVVILDIGMPELNGLEATVQILKELPRTQVLILTVHESEQVIREVLAAGARGYLMKSDAGRDLVAAVEALRNRRPYFTSRVAEMMLEGYLKPGVPTGEEPAVRLTPREREIVQLLAEGKTNKEVANALNISVKTAETHRTNIMNKLKVHSLSELVRYAIRNRMIEP
jgi:DNA-binding NarL/FixJ family response regulator